MLYSYGNTADQKGVVHLMYEYLTLPDETLITHSDIIQRNGVRSVKLHFERPTENGFDGATCFLPFYEWKVYEGKYSELEIANFNFFLSCNLKLIYELAESGGLENA